MILGDILFIMKKLIDQKKHFKMYKSGKTWVVAGIAAVSLLIGSMQVVHADETSVDSQKTIVSASLQPKSTDAESSISVKGTEATSQPNVAPVDQTTDVKNNVADGSDSQDKPLTDSAEMTNESTTITDTKDHAVEPKTNADSQSVGQKNNATVTPNPTEYYNSQNGHWYLKDQNGSNLTGWQKLSGNRTVYYNKTGEMLYGEQNISSKWYFFNTTDGNVAKGWYKLPDGRQVYYDVDSDGNGQGMLHGMQKIGNDYYYFNSGYGTEESGLKEVNGKYYYFSPVMIKNTEKELNGSWYYFGTDGAARTGWYTLSGGRLVNYNAQGQMYHGEAKIDGNWFYFNSIDGNVLQGWQKLADGRRVYYDIDYKDANDSKGMLHGEQLIDNVTYYFNLQNGAQETGVVYNLATKQLQYYGAANGSLSKNVEATIAQHTIKTDDEGNIILNDGQNQIDGQWYYYDSNNHVLVTGWKKLSDSQKVYYDPDTAQMIHGEKKIDGFWFYFDKRTGDEAISKFIKLADGRTVYYDENGHMTYGEKKLRNDWYYFNLNDGNEAVSNFIKLGDGRTVYYDTQGHMVYGWQNINGNTYYFNGQDGNMYVGAQWINGQEYYFDYITGAQVKDQWTAKLLEWFFNRMGKLTYSMDGSRNGADGTADCSGSLTQALYEAGAWRYSLLYNTEMLHSYLLGNGYHLAYENNGYTSPVVGDVIIWGQRGRSAGGAGHTGVISGSGRNGTMVSTCYWTEGEKGTAVQNFPYFWYWGKDNYPYYYVYRR